MAGNLTGQTSLSSTKLMLNGSIRRAAKQAVVTALMTTVGAGVKTSGFVLRAAAPRMRNGYATSYVPSSCAAIVGAVVVGSNPLQKPRHLPRTEGAIIFIASSQCVRGRPNLLRRYSLASSSICSRLTTAEIALVQTMSSGRKSPLEHPTAKRIAL